MLLGGVAEIFLGVRAEGQSLENIATPLTVEEAEADPHEQCPIQAARDLGGSAEQVAGEHGMRRIRRSAERAEHERHGKRRFRPAPARRSTPPARSARPAPRAAARRRPTRPWTARSRPWPAPRSGTAQCAGEPWPPWPGAIAGAWALLGNAGAGPVEPAGPASTCQIVAAGPHRGEAGAPQKGDER